MMNKWLLGLLVLAIVIIAGLSLRIQSLEKAAFEVTLERDAERKVVEAKVKEILSTLAGLTYVNGLLDEITTTPITALMEEDVGAVIARTIAKYPIGFPFKGGVRVTAAFGDNVLEGKLRKHRGIDLVPVGDSVKIYPSASGTIVSFGEDAIYGKWIEVEHEGYRTFYAHLKTIYWQDIENRLVIGCPVTPDTPLGVYGNTGKVVGALSDGRHLHYEVRLLDVGTGEFKPVDPAQFWKLREVGVRG